MHPIENRPTAEVVMTVLHAGGKFDHASYKVSGGLHGVGVSVVNALSEWLKLEIKRDGKVYYQEYRRGDPATAFKPPSASPRRRGTKVTFKPDPEIFKGTEFSFEHPDAAPARAVVPQQRPHDHDPRRARPTRRTSSSSRAASRRSSPT